MVLLSATPAEELTPSAGPLVGPTDSRDLVSKMKPYTNPIAHKHVEAKPQLAY
jgi:hypothetical protein